MSRHGLRIAVFAAALSLLPVTGVAYAEPPSNDDFDHATAITALPFTGEVDLSEATKAPDDPNYCSHLEPASVWYSFTAAEDVTVTLDFHGTYVETAFYTGVRGDLDPVTGTCDSGSGVRALDARAEVTYYLKVTGSHWYGSFPLTVEQVPRPANDDFAGAEVIGSLPFVGGSVLAAAGTQPGEPRASCDGNLGSPSVWYRYTPVESQSLLIATSTPNDYNAVAAVFTGDSLDDLTEVSCVDSYRTLFRAEAGQTLYILLNAPSSGGDAVSLALREAQPLQPHLEYYPTEPSVFDDIRFVDQSWDPEGGGNGIVRLDFGDGTSVTPIGVSYADHRYAADGDYTATLTISSWGDRTATTSEVVRVRTHDVGITGFRAPSSARVGTTKSLEVAVAASRYDESVTVTLYRGTAAGFTAIGTLTKPVPARPFGTVKFAFSHTFTTADLTEGAVVFKAVAEPAGVRDASPGDNTTIAPATRVLP
ncbi:PKD domain-containing protein [Actinosynnema sp. NPDC023658]|uniref:PKD domain-containing protein n=1 Tax=Actinosynnema sp. NPDC023658 TaxID=3155465 RepID=UPI0033CEA5FF